MLLNKNGMNRQACWRVYSRVCKHYQHVYNTKYKHANYVECLISSSPSFITYDIVFCWNFFNYVVKLEILLNMSTSYSIALLLCTMQSNDLAISSPLVLFLDVQHFPISGCQEAAWVTGCDYLSSIRRASCCTERSIVIWDNRSKGKNQVRMCKQLL